MYVEALECIRVMCVFRTIIRFHRHHASNVTDNYKHENKLTATAGLQEVRRSKLMVENQKKELMRLKM